MEPALRSSTVPEVAMHEITTFKWSFEQDVAGYTAAGFANIALVNAPKFPHKIFELDPEDVAKRLRTASLKVSSIASANLFSLDDERRPISQLSRARELVDFATQVDADCLQVVYGPMPATGMRRGLAYGDELLRNLLPSAEQRGVRLGIEPLHPINAADWSIVNSFRQALEIVERFDSPNLGVVFDTHHLWWEAELLSLIRASAGRIVGVHVSDWREENRSRFDRELPGKGVARVAEIAHEIAAAGYAGIWDIEILSEKYWDSDYPTLIVEARSAFEALWA
jgi:sugar phosphate isomerase/epimerase